MFLKILNIRKKTLVLESLFNKAADLKACILLKKIFQHGCFTLNILKFLRTAFETLSVHYTFPKTYVMIEFFGPLWVQN